MAYETVTPGPPKQPKRKTRRKQPELSHHKKRSKWFAMRAAWPNREAAVAQLARARGQADHLLRKTTHTWESAGPDNVGGRTTDLVCDPNDANRIWLGAAGGGVWHSPDGGNTWMCQWHDEASMNIGALAIDPNNADLLYAGTGEANLSADSYPGVGLYRSVDGGKTWHILASSEGTGVPTRIGIIAVDPFDSNHLMLGGVGYSNSEPGGLYQSKDGGLTWKRHDFISAGNYWCHDIVFHPGDQGTVYAVCNDRGLLAGIWRTQSSGNTWKQMKRGLPTQGRFGRGALAIAPSNPDVMYCQVDFQGMVQGIYKTSNGGSNWADVSGIHFRDERQMFYNNTIAVHPKDPDHVICGGVDLHRSKDGGKTWEQVTVWSDQRGTPKYAHADHHRLIMPASNPGLIYDCNDGGLDISTDGGSTWQNRSNGLAITMYYDLAVAPSNAQYFGGGTQDNGTNISVTGSADDHFMILGGDGGWMVFDPTFENRLFASFYNFNIYRFENGWQNVSPPASQSEKGSIWMCFIVMHPTNAQILISGTSRVWRTLNGGNSWQPVSGSLDGSSITAIEIAEADPDVVYVGTENGGFFRSTNGGNTWTADLSSATLPGKVITRIAAHPTDANHVIAVTGGYGNRHAFRSLDGGQSWADIDRGNLPDAPHGGLVFDPQNPDHLYVGSDAGVFFSPNRAATWENMSTDMPNSQVIDLVLHRGTRKLYAATYGRSIWKTDV
ncbi:MAG: hypothetical protein QNK37_21970 [Acidobacteriota bacterium]|nr:hypothetical protein [Acidobacteriota bacterium]